MSSFPDGVLQTFTSTLESPSNVVSNKASTPNYFAADTTTVHSQSTIIDLKIGIGADIYAHHASTLLSTQHELVIVTCFWARSKSLDTLRSILLKLSATVLANGPDHKIRVRICFSSLSILQKIFHTRSFGGKPWPPSTWKSKLGLPDPSELAGLDLQIKSIFILPFSVMHPKFIIIDRHTVLLPSCNVSWEDWLEGCITLIGPVVGQFTRFYDAFWSDKKNTKAFPALNEPNAGSTADQGAQPCLFLPSPHHVNPHFRPLPFLSQPLPPPTPLNTLLLTLFAYATHSITITTPNLTCSAVISALLASIQLGVDVTIYTSSRMMILEQLLTAGTVTEICVWQMRRRYRKLQRAALRSVARGADIEGNAQLGVLKVFYFDPTPIRPEGGGSSGRCAANKLHFKSTIIDDEIVVLGSGNMDRASWYTSQELGVAFASPELAEQVQKEFQTFLMKEDGGRHLRQVI